MYNTSYNTCPDRAPPFTTTNNSNNNIPLSLDLAIITVLSNKSIKTSIAEMEIII